MDAHAYLREHWQTARVAEMAEKLRISEQAVRRLAIKLQLGPRERDVLEPSQQEIDERSAEVRARWSPEERERRLVGLRRRWIVPSVTVRTRE